jgi:hypothetical protein
MREGEGPDCVERKRRKKEGKMRDCKGPDCVEREEEGEKKGR